MRQYNFAGAHFHWGKTDGLGSEHCFQTEESDTRCAAMELHLVHYLSKYGSLKEAVASEDPNGLAVIGVLIETGSVEYESNPMELIAKNLVYVEEAGTGVAVDEPLDFTPILLDSNSNRVQVYAYKGSLTTPGCNEQVNWYVLKKPASVSEQVLSKFRTGIKDDSGHDLNQNFRPRQPLNGREVKFFDLV